MSTKPGKIRKANRRATRMAEGEHPNPMPVSEQIQQQLKGVVNGVELKPAPLDVALVGRAVKERWPVDGIKRPAIVTRLQKIVEKESVTAIVKGELVEAELPADVNAIAAARVLVAMVGQNQADEHHEEKLSKPNVPGTAVQVNVMNGSESQGQPNDPTHNQIPEDIQAAINDPEYVEIRRQRALRRDSKSSVTGQMGE